MLMLHIICRWGLKKQREVKFWCYRLEGCACTMSGESHIVRPTILTWWHLPRLLFPLVMQVHEGNNNEINNSRDQIQHFLSCANGTHLIEGKWLYHCVGAGKNRRWRKHKNLRLDGISTFDEFGNENTSHEPALAFVKLEEIVLATQNFSEGCMIGQGGFGKVYKVACLICSSCYCFQIL